MRLLAPEAGFLAREMLFSMKEARSVTGKIRFPAREAGFLAREMRFTGREVRFLLEDVRFLLQEAPFLDAEMRSLAWEPRFFHECRQKRPERDGLDGLKPSSWRRRNNGNAFSLRMKPRDKEIARSNQSSRSPQCVRISIKDPGRPPGT